MENEQFSELCELADGFRDGSNQTRQGINISC